MKGQVPYVGVFLGLGTAIGTFVFTVTKQAWHIGAGTGIGIIVGAIVQSAAGRGKRDG